MVDEDEDDDGNDSDESDDSGDEVTGDANQDGENLRNRVKANILQRYYDEQWESCVKIDFVLCSVIAKYLREILRLW